MDTDVARTHLFGLPSLAALLWLVACTVTPPPTQLSGTVGTMAATLNLNPERPVPMQPMTLDLWLQDDGQPVVGATVAMTLTMLGCSMPPSYPELQDKGNGSYRAQTALTMAGTWQADAHVALPDGQETLFTFFFATR